MCAHDEASSVEAKERGLSDTNELILEAHFDKFTIGNMKKMVDDWGQQGADIEGQKDAILCLYKATNENFEDFVKFIDNKFGSQRDVTYKAFISFARHASGKLLDSDPILGQCSQLSTLSVVDLKVQVGYYFKGKTNEFLKNEYGETLQEFGLLAANDSEKPGSATSLREHSSDVIKLRSEQKEKFN